jgi:hypothetical protein
VEYPRDLGSGHGSGLARYTNVPRLIGTLVSSRLATLHELQTVYGLEDAYDLLELLSVDGYNERLTRLPGKP